jgi:hypothetical protein
MTTREDPLASPVTATFTGLMRLALAMGGTPATSGLEVTLPGVPASVPVARCVARDILDGCPRTDDRTLAVTQLAANAIAHSASGQGGTFRVRVRTAARWARVEVADDGPAAGVLPAPRNGWGLQIVAGVTDRTGDYFDLDGRRAGWAEITLAAVVPARDRDPGGVVAGGVNLSGVAPGVGPGRGGAVGVPVYCLVMAAKPEPGSLVVAAQPGSRPVSTVASYVITRLGLVG